MLTGRSELPTGFDPNKPRPTDWPSIPASYGAYPEYLFQHAKGAVPPRIARSIAIAPWRRRSCWGRVQTVFFAGGGVRGNAVVGSSDRFGGEPASDPQRPEDLAATIFHALGLAPGTPWHDELGRPFPISDGRPIPGLFARA